jgi:hypothetical protein
MSKVICEAHGMTAHAESADCLWPHYVHPPHGTPTQIGHPYRVTD